MMLVIVCANARLIMENLLKYGILANPAHWVVFFVPDGALLFCCQLLCLVQHVGDSEAARDAGSLASSNSPHRKQIILCIMIPAFADHGTRCPSAAL